MSGLYQGLEKLLLQNAIGKALAEQYLDKGIPLKITSLWAVRAACRELTEAFPGATVAYAMKADPRPEMLQAVRDHNFTVEINSPGELEAAGRAGFEQGGILYSNPDRLDFQTKQAMENGVTLFVSQSEDDIDRLAALNKSRADDQRLRVIVRLLSGNNTGTGFDIDGATPGHLPRYGVSVDEAVRLLERCSQKGLIPYGVSGHVGTQVRSPAAWDNLITSAASVDEKLRTRHGIHIEFFDLGGGLPWTPANPAPPAREFGRHLQEKIRDAFKEREKELKLMIEPGTYIANHSVLLGTVLGARYSGSELYVTTTLGRYNAGMLGDDNPVTGILRREGNKLVRSDAALKEVTLFGAVTANSDCWAQSVFLPGDVRNGDVILVEGGAYSGAAQSDWSLQEQPREFFLRKGQSMKQLMQEIKKDQEKPKS